MKDPSHQGSDGAEGESRPTRFSPMQIARACVGGAIILLVILIAIAVLVHR